MISELRIQRRMLPALIGFFATFSLALAAVAETCVSNEKEAKEKFPIEMRDLKTLTGVWSNVGKKPAGDKSALSYFLISDNNKIEFQIDKKDSEGKTITTAPKKVKVCRDNDGRLIIQNGNEKILMSVLDRRQARIKVNDKWEAFARIMEKENASDTPPFHFLPATNEPTPATGQAPAAAAPAAAPADPKGTD